MSAAAGAGDGNRFGTFAGVFTPCVLTVLGVIMFLRFGVVVGQAGLPAAIAIVVASKLITVLTSLSLSAIATNTRVEVGGAYFLISRSLGPEFGGAIGLMFFAAQALSVAMYVIGFTEALMGTLPVAPNFTAVAVVTNVAVFACVMIGAGWTIKIQFGILALIVASLASFAAGAAGSFDVDLLYRNLDAGYRPGESFWTMFALFFPAVTGIMAGANMSGDLREPARAIPRGTLWAVAVTAIIYLTQAVLLAGARDRESLITNNLILADIAAVPALIGAGVISATLSSALGSMMGAPRILQSLARDRLFRWLAATATGSGKKAEPRRAILVTFLISTSGILLADLDTIAPLITMAFLVTYGLLNLATFYEAITKNPSYRPKFRYCHWSTSLAGAIGCVVVMLLIDWRWAIVSVGIVASLHAYLTWMKPPADWGDLQSGWLFEKTRRNLIKLEDELYHPKNWRPFVLALSGTGYTRPQLVVFGSWLTAETGILSLGQVIPGQLDDRHERRISQEKILHTMIRQRRLNAFPAVVVDADYTDGVESLVQCQGLGRLRPNIVLLGYPLTVARRHVFCGLLRNLEGLGRSTVVYRRLDRTGDEWAVPSGTIDVWWRGRANGELMMLLAHLIQTHRAWRSRRLRLLRVVDSDAGIGKVRSHLAELLKSARIDGVAEVVVSRDSGEAIQTKSRDAALVIIGMQPPRAGEEDAFFQHTEELVGDLPRVALVRSAGGMRLES